MSEEQHDTIDALMAENRKFPPSEAFRADALVRDTSLYDEAAADDEGFWARQAAELVDWAKQWDTILDWQLPYAKWFIGGQLNVAHNCLDRHVDAGRGDTVAIHWEGEPGDTRAITYAELLTEVSKFANVLKSLGDREGRSRQHLHADDPRGRRGDAGLRPDRRTAQRRVRWVLGAVAGRPHQRRRRQSADHRRRWLPPWRGVPAQAGLSTRRSPNYDARSNTSSWSSAAATTSPWSTAATTGTTT